MKICKACARNYAAAMQTCPFCGAGSDYDPAAPPPPPPPPDVAPAAIPRSATPPVMRRTPKPLSDMVVMGDAVESSRFQVSWLFLAVLVAIGGAVAYWMMPKQLDISMLEPTDPAANFCQGQPRCVAIYITPWCPACRTSLRMLDQIREQLEEDNIGVAVVIGNDEAKRSRQVGALIGETAWLDRGDLMLKNLGIETVPTWLRLDGQFNVYQRLEGTFRPMDYHLEKLGIYAPLSPDEAADE